jgi:hypothetical protein
LKAEDYPALIPPGGRVDTIAVPAVLAAYNWTPGSERYRKVDHFVQAFFEKFSQFQQPPFHPKWKEVVLNAPLKGWTRFAAAQTWLDEHANTPSAETRSKFDQFLAARASQSAGQAPMTPEQNEALFRQFLQWQQKPVANVPERRRREAAPAAAPASEARANR